MTPPPFPAVNGTEPCASGDPERFFPDSEAQVAAAKKHCRGCHVLDGCLAYALTHKVSGVWAGTTGDEREDQRRKQGIKAASLSFAALVPGPKPTPITEHGHWGAVSRHRTIGERLCDGCREFTNQKRREQKAKKNAEIAS